MRWFAKMMHSGEMQLEEAKSRGESLPKAGDHRAAAKYLDVARRLEAAKPRAMSDHTRTQQAHSHVRRLEKQMGQTLSKVVHVCEQRVDAEATLRTVRNQVNQADADYKASLAALQGSHKSEEEPQATVGSFKLEDLVACFADLSKFIGCSHIMEDLSVEAEAEASDLEQFQKRKEELSSGVTTPAREMPAQVADHAKNFETSTELIEHDSLPRSARLQVVQLLQ
ncbi:unnamed protein product, partial [Prorocentrum cordatum]